MCAKAYDTVSACLSPYLLPTVEPAIYAIENTFTKNTLRHFRSADVLFVTVASGSIAKSSDGRQRPGNASVIVDMMRLKIRPVVDSSNP